MKCHLSSKLLQKFSILQSRMLEESSKYTRPGGRILYGTCSLTLEENEFLISRFLSPHPDFETHPVLEHYRSPALWGETSCRRCHPHRDKTAGDLVAMADPIG